MPFIYFKISNIFSRNAVHSGECSPNTCFEIINLSNGIAGSAECGERLISNGIAESAECSERLSIYWKVRREPSDTSHA